MNRPLAMSWSERNQAFLVAEFARLHARLDGQRDVEPPSPIAPPAAIDALAAIFKLSRFERDLLLLCAGVEMESSIASRCAEAAGAARSGAPTFGLAIATLPEPHWSALAPGSPLRLYRLVDIEPGRGVTAAPLRIDERVLHYIAGVNAIDPRLEPMLRETPVAELMDTGHRALAETLEPPAPGERAAALHLFGDDPGAQEAVAALVADRAGRSLLTMRMEDTPGATAELEQFVRLWAREAALLPACLLLQWEGETPGGTARQLAERAPGPLVIASREPLRLHRRLERREVSKPEPAGQKRLWSAALGSAAAAYQTPIDDAAQHFRLGAETIATIAAQLARRPEDDPGALWRACRSIATPRLSHLAERIIPSARWDDLVLPPLQVHLLRQLAGQQRRRMTVYEDWGFAAKDKRGLGVGALFFGPSGTGKTLAAEVLAAELGLDLYRIDLSSVVSKYIGETEKNLREVFDAAEGGGALLLFDEADALFGKRSEVKDSHDRYANIEVGYLLQRMESFRGIAILTTNMKSALDKSFERRLRFTVEFPFPDAAQRQAIWARAFPAQTPTRSLQFDRLARLNVAGGNIRNIALNAAFLAAEAGAPVEMAHLLQAARIEALKMERPLSDVEIRGWA
jgi:hypothetical protein